jgi:ribokinase
VPAKSVVVLGSLNCDLIVHLDHLPNIGETRAGSGGRMTMGGKGFNQAVAARRQGCAVQMIGTVGDDPMGQMARAALKAADIGDDHVETATGVEGGCAAIMVSQNGDNIIGVAPGANAMTSVNQVRAAETMIAQSAILIAQLETPIVAVAEALALARKHGVLTLLNPAPATVAVADVLPLVDLLVPNLGELEVLTGQPIGKDEVALQTAMKRVVARGAKCVITTLGADGAAFWDGQRFAKFPAPAVRAIDTVGAGDVFCGALAAALAEAMPITGAIARAQIAAAISVTRQSADCAPSRDDTDAELIRLKTELVVLDDR